MKMFATNHDKSIFLNGHRKSSGSSATPCLPSL